MASKTKKDILNVALKCTICGERNYITTRNKKNTPDKLEKMKYCPRCNKETLHKETKNG